MDDEFLAARAAEGNLDSYGELYDRYFSDVYDFAWRTLRDEEAAGAVTGDAFRGVLHGALNGRAPDFRSRLFVVAHGVALRRAGATADQPGAIAPAHEEAFGTFETADPCRLTDPAVADGDEDLGCLVWEGMASLSARDYALLDLHVRRDLGDAELAPVIGGGRASRVLGRLTEMAGDVVAGYVIARRCEADCSGLREALAPYDFPPYTDDVRRAVDAHVRSCEQCQAVSELPSPLEIFRNFAPVAAPYALKGDVWRSLVAVGAPVGAGVAAAAGGGDGVDAAAGPPMLAAAGGFGDGGAAAVAEGWDEQDPRRRLLWFIGAAAGLLVLAFVVGALITSAFNGGDGGGAVAPTEVATDTPRATATRTPTRTPTASPTATDTPTPSPTNTPPPTLTPLPTNTAVPADTPTPPPPPTATPRPPTPRPPPPGRTPTPDVQR